MEIFNYHPFTGEFLTVGVADDNPLEPDDPIVPGYATKIAPPQANERRVPVYLNESGIPPQNWPEGAWTLIADYRDVPLYRTADGSVFNLSGEYSGLGDLPSFLTEEPRPSPAHVWIDGTWTLDPTLETEQLSALVRREQSVRLYEADQLIAPLMDGFVLGELTTEDEDALKALSQYRKALRVVTSQPGFPRNIDWPAKPNS